MSRCVWEITGSHGNSWKSQIEQTSEFKYPKYPNIQKPRNSNIPNIQISKYPNIQISKYPKYPKYQNIQSYQIIFYIEPYQIWGGGGGWVGGLISYFRVSWPWPPNPLILYPLVSWPRPPEPSARCADAPATGNHFQKYLPGGSYSDPNGLLQPRMERVTQIPEYTNTRMERFTRVQNDM